MKIEVAVPSSATSKERGDLLEKLAEKLLKAQSYTVQTEVRRTAVELDLLCRHSVNHKEIYVECKAYRDKNIDSNILKQLAGTLVLNEHSEAWLISTAPLGKDAKGFEIKWSEKPLETASRLSIYTPEKVIKSLEGSGVIRTHPYEKAIDCIGSENLLGEWILLVTPYGTFWVATTLSGGIPNGAICFYAKNNELVSDPNLLQNLSGTDTSLNSLDFTISLGVDAPSNSPNIGEIADVVEVQTGEAWSDYRPARPQDFVGRTKDIKQLFTFFKHILSQDTKTRVFALTGDSGMGKSSLIATISHKSRNKRNKSKYYVYAVDVRAAISPTYVYSALLKCLKRAQLAGFGDPEISLVLSDVQSPLDSITIKNYLESLKKNEQLIVMVFDQFEELYSKPELNDIFERTKSLLLNVAALQANFCLGFAWKSDSTTPSEHPAYFMWHSLSDMRLEIKLSPFLDRESNAAINLFEKEIQQILHTELRHNLMVSSQGYPWLLKKLCIHLYDKIHQGTRQQDLLKNRLDVESLFDSDLTQLDQSERACLDFIAQRAPVDWFEVTELSSHQVLTSLINRRLVVKSGDRLNIYWDIFREYLLTKKVPIIPLHYLPSTDFRTFLKIVTALNPQHSTTLAHLSSSTNLSEGTINNIALDSKMFDIAQRDNKTIILRNDIKSNDEVSILRLVREKLKKHIFTLKIQRRSSNSEVTLNEAITIMKELFPNNEYAEKTWYIYTSRLCRWLEQCGLIVSSHAGWTYRDLGDVKPLKSTTKHSGELFTGPTSPAQTEAVLMWLTQIGTAGPSNKKPKGFRNAICILSRFGLITSANSLISPNHKRINGSSAKDAIWKEAVSERTLQYVKQLIKTNPTISGREVGNHLNKKYSLNWTKSSQQRNGNAIRQWALWIFNGEMAGRIPSCPGRQAS